MSFKQLLTVFFLSALPFAVFAENAILVQERIKQDASEGKPLVAHVVVALVDRNFQGIVSSNPSLEDGDSPRTNQYWGALYGVKTHFKRNNAWKMLEVNKPDNPLILERIAFKKNVKYKGNTTTAYIIADAWRGRNIKNAIKTFLDMSAGKQIQTVEVGPEGRKSSLSAGGNAHVVTFIGHNGLMDFSLPTVKSVSDGKKARSSIILACYSDRYFSEHLETAKSHSLLTTNGLMAPEAYILEAALSSWFSGETPSDTHLAAARSYNKYQDTGLSAAKRLFSSH